MQRLLRGLRHVPEQRISHESTPKRLEAHLRDFLKRRHPSPRFSPRDTRFWGVITFQEKLRTPRGRAPFSSTPPGSQHTTRAARWGDPRVGASSSQKCPGASRDNRLRAPRPAPAARAALHARERSRRQGRSADGGQRRLWRAWICSGLTVSSAAAAGRRGRLGEDTIWQRLQLLPAASSSRLWEEAATSRQRQLRWRPRQHHIPLLLASSLTLRPPPRCHGNAAPRRLAPPLPLVPASRDLSGGVPGPPLPVPFHRLPKGRARDPEAAQNDRLGRKGGDAVSGRAGLARKVGR